MHPFLSQYKAPAMQSTEGGSNYMSNSSIHMSTSAQATLIPVQQQQQHRYQPIEQYQYGEAFFANTTFPTFYKVCGQGGGGGYIDSQTRSQVANNNLAVENYQRSNGIVASHKSTLQDNVHLSWLNDNLEVDREGSVCRCALYGNYVRHCQGQKLEPVNKPSLGKLIHSIFPDLKRRRLGTRGNSRYHYYGIRVKPDSLLSKLQEDQEYMLTGKQPIHQEQSVMDSMSDGSQSQRPTNIPEKLEASQSLQHLQQYMNISRDLPRFPTLDNLCSQPLPKKDINELQTLYRKNCEAILDVVKNLQFHRIEKLWQSFWCSTVPSSDRGATVMEPLGMVTKDNLVALCKYEHVRMWMRSCDSILYEAMVEILIPNVLCKVDSNLIRDIRNFAQSVEGWMTTAMRDFPKDVVHSKVEVVRALAQILRHYTTLNHLAQQARSQLQNASTMNKLLDDLNKVDFTSIQKQASWVCQCDEGVVRNLEQNLKAALRQPSSGDQWATWLDGVVSQVLKRDQDNKKCVEDAQQFLLKWSFYSSMVIRDVTRRTSATFGTCHLIRMLYDEYMLYLVERWVAKDTKQMVISVIGEFNKPSCTRTDDTSEVSDLGSNADVSRRSVKRKRTEI